MPLAAALAPTPCGAAEHAVELGARVGRQKREVDLMCVLVLYDAPGEGAGVEQVGVEPDLLRRRRGRDARPDVNHDRAGHDPPGEGARIQCRRDLSLLRLGATVEPVVAA